MILRITSGRKNNLPSARQTWTDSNYSLDFQKMQSIGDGESYGSLDTHPRSYCEIVGIRNSSDPLRSVMVRGNNLASLFTVEPLALPETQCSTIWRSARSCHVPHKSREQKTTCRRFNSKACSFFFLVF